MLALIPDWAIHYDAFWDAVKKRNYWFINLRYIAVSMLFCFIVFTELYPGFSYSPQQLKILLITNAAILVYNVLFQISGSFIKNEPGRLNFLHFSFFQIVADLCALYVVVYYTGAVESPLKMLFIFHMIIGSLILPGKIVYSLAFLVVGAFNVIAYLEFAGIIPHHKLFGFLPTSLYDDGYYIFITVTFFSFVVLSCVFIANRIARELYLLEQNLVGSLEKLNKAEKEKQRYIMAVVHEIKTPLSAVNSYLKIILSKLLGEMSPQIEERLIRAESRSDEAIELINNVLRISRLKLLDEFSVEKIHVRNTIDRVISKLNSLIEQKNVSIEINDESKATELSGDPFLIEMVLSNIIGNAVKYSHENGRVCIHLLRYDRFYTIKISDNGVGIPEKEIPKLFDDFYRASNVKDKGYEGTGLGLSVVKLIVERHGGTITIKSPSEIGDKNYPGTDVEIAFQVGDTSK